MEKYGIVPNDVLIALLPAESQTKIRKAIEYSVFLDEGSAERRTIEFGSDAGSQKVWVAIKGRQHYTESAHSVEQCVEGLYTRLRGYVTQKRGALKKKVNDSNEIKNKAESALKDLDALLRD